MSGIKKYEIQLNRKQILYTLIALFASFLLTFTLGVLIGTRFPSSKKSSDFKSSVPNTPVKSFSYKPFESSKTSHTQGKKTIPQFTFYDTLPEYSELPLTNEMEKAKDKKGIVTKMNSEKDKRLKQDMVRERYTIQLGSFQKKEKAYALQNKLKKQGYLAYVTSKKIKDKGTWYRVRMGNFNTLKEAQYWISKMGNHTPPPFITSTTN